jgi:hypothetical protein
MLFSERQYARTVSLLYPTDVEAGQQVAWSPLDTHCIKDLDLSRLFTILGTGKHNVLRVDSILSALCTDPLVVRYRQDILEDLLNFPRFREGFEVLLPLLNELAYASYREERRKPVFYEVVWRLNELNRLVECVHSLQRLFDKSANHLRSEGLRTLHQQIQDLAREPIFQQLEQELPPLRNHITNVKSLTIGVNLDQNLLPTEATLLSVSNEPVTRVSFWNKLFGPASDGKHGIAPLHIAPTDTGTGISVSPLMTPLFRDLADVLDKACQPLVTALKRYVSINSGPLANIGQEMNFYVKAARLITRIHEAGLPMCKPEIAPKEERACDIENNFNLNLALHLLDEQPKHAIRERLITNPVHFGEQGRIMLLTGPNMGGKTTYMQAIGLTHVLAQAGLYVPGTHARISPVDTVVTHFPEEEQFDAGTGRFGDEAQRMHEIFMHITRHSLILFNESFSSTSPAEALELSRDIVRLLREMGVRAVFATHLHELAAETNQLNATITGDSRIISMVASLIEDAPSSPDEASSLDERAFSDFTDHIVRRSYKIIPSPPMKTSRARELAHKHGITFDQLHTLLRERGVLNTEGQRDFD